MHSDFIGFATHWGCPTQDSVHSPEDMQGLLIAHQTAEALQMSDLAASIHMQDLKCIKTNASKREHTMWSYDVFCIFLAIGIKYSCFTFKMEETVTLIRNFPLWCNILYYVMLGIEWPLKRVVLQQTNLVILETCGKNSKSRLPFLV